LRAGSDREDALRSETRLHESHWPADTSEPLLEITLGGLLRQVASEVPDRVALVDAVANPTQRRRWTYAELLTRAEQTARALLKRFSPGERVAVCAPNGPEWIWLQHGLSFAGLVMTPINPTFKAKEIEAILRDSEAVGVFHANRFRDNDLEEIIASLRPRLPRLRETIPMSRFEVFIGDFDSSTSLPTIAPRDILQIQYTSGTTGVPKGACLHHLGAINTSRFVARRACFTDAGVWLNAMPMFHIAGPVVTAMATLSSRGTYVLAPGFDPAAMLELIESERANATLIVPTMILAMLDHPDFKIRDHASMRVITTGAAMVPATLVKRTKEAFGSDVMILFGQTEVNGVVSTTTLDDSVDDQSQTLGRPLPQVEVRIVDVVTGRTLPIGTPGEFCVRGYQNMHGYCGPEAASSVAIDEDGWLHMGDIGVMDERGYLRITGRLKDMIIRGGMNIYPREIEDVLFDHPGVNDVSVIGVPDDKWGESIAAVIRPVDGRAPPAPEDLHAFCRERLAAHKAPSLWFFVAGYPTTASGKIQKFVLQDWVRDRKIAPAMLIDSRSRVASSAGG
jgi:fatty-acyl-CoA synthase